MGRPRRRAPRSSMSSPRPRSRRPARSGPPGPRTAAADVRPDIHDAARVRCPGCRAGSSERAGPSASPASPRPLAFGGTASCWKPSNGSATAVIRVSHFTLVAVPTGTRSSTGNRAAGGSVHRSSRRRGSRHRAWRRRPLQAALVLFDLALDAPIGPNTSRPLCPDTGFLKQRPQRRPGPLGRADGLSPRLRDRPWRESRRRTPAHSIVTGNVALGRARRSVIELERLRTSLSIESDHVRSSVSGTSKWIRR